MVLNKKELVFLFETNSKEKYQKKGKFLFRLANLGETILTIVNGKLETINKASKNDVILRNIEIGSSAETYIIDADKFVERYESSSESHCIDGQSWNIALAKGQIEAYCYLGATIQFIAPWGENMICYYGDYLARPIPGDKNDIYRIEKDAFKLTYSEIQKQCSRTNGWNGL